MLTSRRFFFSLQLHFQDGTRAATVPLGNTAPCGCACDRAASTQRGPRQSGHVSICAGALRRSPQPLLPPPSPL